MQKEHREKSEQKEDLMSAPGWSKVGSQTTIVSHHARRKKNENRVNQQRNQDSKMVQQGTNRNTVASYVDSPVS